MSRHEVNSETQRIFSNLSDDHLQLVLDYSKDALKTDRSKLMISKNSGKILKEDAQLLKQLPQ